MIELLKAADPEGEAYETSLLERGPTREIVAMVIERKTGTAKTYRLARAMFETPEYTGFVKIHKELDALAGTPPFHVVLGKKDGDALSFEELRAKVLEICRDGVPLQRFKGLGEMNADQLFDTTMDPEQPHAAAGHDRRRQRRRPDLLDADGRQPSSRGASSSRPTPAKSRTWTSRDDASIS